MFGRAQALPGPTVATPLVQCADCEAWVHCLCAGLSKQELGLGHDTCVVGQ